MQGGNLAWPLFYRVLMSSEPNRGEICADWAVSSTRASRDGWVEWGLCVFFSDCDDFLDYAEQFGW